MVSLRTPHSLALPRDTSKSKSRLSEATLRQESEAVRTVQQTDHLIPGAGIMRSIASLKYTPNRNSRTLTSHNRALRIMSEREQDVQSQPSQRRAGIELLGDGHETYVVLLEETKHSGEVQQ